MSGAANSIALVGAGNMGGALLAGWLADGYSPQSITIIDPSPPRSVIDIIADHQLRHELAAPGNYQPDVIIIALKPQVMDAALPAIRPLVGPNTVTVSVAAGTTIGSIEHILGKTAIVRAMSNTPAQVRRAITVCVGNSYVTTDHRTSVTHLLASVGQVEWVESETLIDAVTGLSGSGPAYVFHLAEAMARAGVTAGLPEKLALSLARATICGAAELMHQSPLSAAELRANVTSPNGTTQAALEILMADEGLTALMTKAIAAATKRSSELAG